MEHGVGFIGPVETFYGPDIWIAECLCHDPDSFGEGRADFAGNNYSEAYELLMGHIEEVENA